MYSTIVMAFLAMIAGIGVSCGVFAFVLVIGVIPRVISKTGIKNIILVENVMMVGVILGNISSIYMGEFLHNQYWILAIYGICTGIFVGCIAVALAEILHTFPILFKRMKIREGLTFVMISMACGKFVGALFYFISGFAL